MTRDTRRRMVAGAARMIGTGGVDAMSLRELAEREEVPLGSLYHYFPGGKADLVDEAVRLVGVHVLGYIEATAERGADDVLQVFADVWRRVLEESDFASGCAVLAAATAGDPRHHEVARTVFEDWHRALTASLAATGVPPDRAPRLARTVVAAIEGAVGIARATGSADALDDVVAELGALVAAARA